MKQKGNKLQDTTMVCSRRKHKLKSVNSDNENAKKDKTRNVLRHSPEITLTKSDGLYTDGGNVSIISVEQTPCENNEDEFKENKNVLNVSELNEVLNDSHNINCHNSGESNSNDCDLKVETEPTENEKGQSERMPSQNGLKGQNNKHTNLTTILENVKGEEKAIKWSSKEVKGDSDKNSMDIISKINNSSGEKELKEFPNNMSQERKTKTPPIVIPNAHVGDHKKETDTHDSGKDVLLSGRKSKKSSQNDENVKVDGKQNGRPVSAMSDPGSCASSVRSRKSTPRRRRAFGGISFTKEELEYYLPRKSNFSCHEKALKDAGLDVDDLENKRNRRFKRRVKQEIENKDIDEKLKVIEEANAKPVPEDEVAISPICEEEELKEAEEEQSEMEKLKQEKSKKKGKKKTDEYEVKVDHTVLLQYLKYVTEHPDEYALHKKHILQQNTSLFNVDTASTIARFGRIFERGQHGTMDHNFLLEVTRGIKSNYGDSVSWVSPSKDKSNQLNTKVEQVQQDTTVDEKDKTDYEKIKTKLDKWLKTVTTAQLLKAKELSLKELGEEDKLQSQWWSALQPCRYLRQRSHLE